ncbi:MAG: hypothetical protein V1709_10755 [Planctomycetota bacterium]
MKIKSLLILLFVIMIAVGGIIYYLPKTGQGKPYVFPKLPPKEGVIDIDWNIFKKVIISPARHMAGGPDDKVYPPEVKSIVGKRIRILGAAYLLQHGIVNNEIHCFALMPPEMADLSVPTPEPKIQQTITVYVDYHINPLPIKEYFFRIGQSLPVFYVEGIFQLSNDSNFGLFILTDSLVTPFTIQN